MTGEGAPPLERTLYRRLASEARPEAPRIALLFLLGVLATPLALLTPVPLKIVVDSVLDDKPIPGFIAWAVPSGDDAALAAAVVLAVSVAALVQAQLLASEVLRTITGERLVLGLRTRLFRHLQRLSVAYHDLRGTSDSLYRLQYDTLSIQHIAVDTLIAMVTASFTVVAMLVVTAMIDLALAAVALAITPALLVGAWYSRPRLKRRARDVKRLESNGMTVAQESLAAARVVKAFGREDHEAERFATHFHEGMGARVRYALASTGYGGAVAMVTAVGTALVLFIGTRRVESGAVTLGELILVMSYLGQLYAPLKTLSKNAGSLQFQLASAERVFATLDQEPDVAERDDARGLERAAGHVAFDHVSFAYDSGPPVLDDVSFRVPAGTRVGLAGTTGAGKTTLVSLLNRFYDPDSGRVLLDGHDLRDLRLADVRRQFAIVLQEPVLFSTTIAENIAYARPDADDDAIEAAARAAGVHEAILRLPDGYDTQVGDRGLRLSGGERQRVSLARAFLKDAPILILDEPTSAVDIVTERLIMEAMERLMEGRTVFLIAHRLSTLESCDIKLTIRDGRIADVSRVAHA